MIAYARVLEHSREGQELIGPARRAALTQIGEQGVGQVQRLSQLEAGTAAGHALIRAGVLRPLNDLVLDWQEKT
ncbi:MAG TPA: hypothetical protein VGQ23_17785 [Burkholderiaceae bacterium]|nr:hypothetical protein [Burkholderiaceae bacterium]